MNKSEEILNAMNEETIEKIITEFQNTNNATKITTIAAIAKLCMDGGTNASIGNLTIVAEGLEFQLKTLKDCIKKHAGEKATVRQLAGSMERTITIIALKHHWIGPLTTALRRIDKTLTGTDLTYATDFHENSPTLPEKVKNAVEIRARELQKPKQKKIGKKKEV